MTDIIKPNDETKDESMNDAAIPFKKRRIVENTVISVDANDKASEDDNKGAVDEREPNQASDVSADTNMPSPSRWLSSRSYRTPRIGSDYQAEV
jgi:hypothetical protein